VSFCPHHYYTIFTEIFHVIRVQDQVILVALVFLRLLGVMHTRDVSLMISLCDAISIENFLSFQIAIASSSDKYSLFFRMCKHLFTLKKVKRICQLTRFRSIRLLWSSDHSSLINGKEIGELRSVQRDN